MRFTFLFILVLITGSPLFAQQYTISGKITDDAGKPVSFASVYTQNTTRGASANSEGEYSISLKPGKYTLQYKAVGYKQESKEIDATQNRTIDVTLNIESYQLQAVNVGGKDPAYAIMRKAIKKRKSYLNEVKAYSALVYIKGMQKLLQAPKKFLGANIDQIGKQIGLDSNRRGIIYLSESESKYSFQSPNNVHEEMISSKVSGSNRAFSFNRASDLKVNFYENFEDWRGISLRPLISPVADNAFFYYNYKWLGQTVENGKTINKIKVIPRREHDPCFEGFIYIQDDSWRLVGVNLYITKKANISLVDTIRINQQFVPVNDKAWMTSTLRFDFVGGLFGFRVGGYFISVYKDYDLNPIFNKKDFNEVLRITKGVNKKDSTYWAGERPIPLTEEERTDYKKKEALAIKRESKPYLDSIDHIFNKFKPINLLIGGINIGNRYKKEYYHFDALTTNVRFNTVQGFNLNYGASFTKQIDSINNRYFRVGLDVGYGFSDHLFNAVASGMMPVGDSFTLSLKGGSDVEDLNDLQPISYLANTVHSLFAKQNFEKFYQKQFVAASIYGRISGGWQGSASAEFAGRTWLENTTNYSFYGSRNFTYNNPLALNTGGVLFPENQSFKVTLRTSYDFSNKYETYPNGKHYIPSPYPAIGFNYTKGVKGVFGSDVDYDRISADIQQANVSMGVYGRTSFYIGAGKFLNAKSLYFPDYSQFHGNEALFYQSEPNSFLLLNYYTYSNRTEYIEAHLEHNFSGFILNKIPGLRKLKLQEIIHANYLTSPELKDYYELGAGIKYLNLTVLYGESHNSAANVHSALRVSLNF
ncbi:DUF5686 and carboxypeptidase regulatory-like domain-containing protein [Mucilaginibacter sp. dw_454]|uniref:DUF5686 and carboxypeptidase regulatory-like domain-containing protein n=1 Tax=Mucilaginibacter sp. dw_454 TaxID=2720079 RepID=UPI001BD2896D|nr:DUF5686 and carboxypeptidase regulatory-like domain-containing protein [Mucilaginibacter sp. dw_454]